MKSYLLKKYYLYLLFPYMKTIFAVIFIIFYRSNLHRFQELFSVKTTHSHIFVVIFNDIILSVFDEFFFLKMRLKYSTLSRANNSLK